MSTDTVERLDGMFAESPVMRAEEVLTGDEGDLASLPVAVPFSDDYREFLLRYGGAAVAAYPVFVHRMSWMMIVGL